MLCNHSVIHPGGILYLLVEWNGLLCSNFFKSSDQIPMQSTIKNFQWKTHFQVLKLQKRPGRSWILDVFDFILCLTVKMLYLAIIPMYLVISMGFFTVTSTSHCLFSRKTLHLVWKLQHFLEKCCSFHSTRHEQALPSTHVYKLWHIAPCIHICRGCISVWC